MKYLLVLTFAATLWSRDIHVQILSDSPQAAATLLDKLSQEGKGRGLTFVPVERGVHPDYKLVVQWRHGGPGFQAPTAEVQVLAGDNGPLYTVTRRSYGVTRSGAVGRCAHYIVENLPDRK